MSKYKGPSPDFIVTLIWIALCILFYVASTVAMSGLLHAYDSEITVFLVNLRDGIESLFWAARSS